MNLLCGLANVIWLYIFVHNDPPTHPPTAMTTTLMIHKHIPLVIFLNGILYHICLPNWYTKHYDILTNLAFVLFINYYTSKTFTTGLATLFVGSVFCINQWYQSDAVHVLLINWPLAYLYLRSCWIITWPDRNSTVLPSVSTGQFSLFNKWLTICHEIII